MKKTGVFGLSNTHLILLSFLGAVILGGVLLTLPFSTRAPGGLSLTDAFFTAATSVCVTGLVTVPIADLAPFGQAVVLVLIQVGGLGVVTVMGSFSLSLHKKMGMGDRLLLQDAFNLTDVSGVVKFMRRVLFGTLIAEGVGAVLFAFAFVPRYGAVGIWYALFQSVSAFCNAGLDLLGTDSLCGWASSPLVCGTTACLVVLGGLGFVVWWDVARVIRERRGLRGLTLHSKIALTATAFLILAGAAVYLILEFDNPRTFGGFSVPDKIRMALFQSVTTRTAGFAAVPQEGLRGGSVLVTTLLMAIGGSPVGTAGGMKTVTFIVLFSYAVATARGRRDVTFAKRRIPRQALHKAVSVAVIFLTTAFTAAVLLCLIQRGDAGDVLFEAFSATGTVGLSRGVTSHLTALGKWVVIAAMYLGRVGPVSLAVAFGLRRETRNLIRDPEEEICVG